MAPKKSEGRQEPTIKPAIGYSRSAKTVMWFGVISLSLIILILWGWAFRLQLSLVNFGETPEGTLIKKTKTDWDQAFAANKTEVTKKETLNQVKTVLSQIITNASAPATTTQAVSTTLSNQKP